MTHEEFAKQNVLGLSGKELEKEIKKGKIFDLFFNVCFVPFDQFFDLTSNKLLDEKIEVLTAIKQGKRISEIPKFYDVLELYPKDGRIEGEFIVETCWD